ncbi:MAG: outer membrane lipoprotein-sorting protein [Magnetococcales bacterium]|nr:outer membrane lipoprotein-sorting protein [Magnetococcales bacterium]
MQMERVKQSGDRTGAFGGVAVRRSFLVLICAFIAVSVGSVTVVQAESGHSSNSIVQERLRGQAILERMDEVLFPRSFETYFSVENRRPRGDPKHFTFYAARKGSDRWVALITEPEERRGESYLKIGDALWVRKPGAYNASRLSLAGSMIQGMLSNADLLPSAFHVDYHAVVESEESDLYTLKLTPKRTTLPYREITMQVHTKLMAPVTVTYFGAGPEPLKVIAFKNVRRLSTLRQRPMQLHATNRDNPRYQSFQRIGSIEERVFPDEVFTPGFLPRVGRLLLPGRIEDIVGR